MKRELLQNSNIIKKTLKDSYPTLSIYDLDDIEAAISETKDKSLAEKYNGEKLLKRMIEFYNENEFEDELNLLKCLQQIIVDNSFEEEILKKNE